MPVLGFFAIENDDDSCCCSVVKKVIRKQDGAVNNIIINKPPADGFFLVLSLAATATARCPSVYDHRSTASFLERGQDMLEPCPIGA